MFFKLEILSVAKKYGKGVIEKIEDTVIAVRFPEVGEKKLGLKWCVQNCKINKRL